MRYAIADKNQWQIEQIIIIGADRQTLEPHEQ